MQVCCLFYFLSIVHFSKVKIGLGFRFFNWIFKKIRVFFMVASNYINPKDNYGHLIDLC